MGRARAGGLHRQQPPAVKKEYRIEGFRVFEGDLGSGKTGWRCECWKIRPPDQGPKPSCTHSRYVEHTLNEKGEVEESGAKVVPLKRK
jgi:hypothetical protein